MAYSEAKGSGSGRKLDHLKVSKGKKGFSVEHHFQQGSMNAYHPPEVHNFGDNEGPKMLAHVGGALGVDRPSEPEEPEEEGQAGPAEGEYYTEAAGRKGDRPYPRR